MDLIHRLGSLCRSVRRSNFWGVYIYTVATCRLMVWKQTLGFIDRGHYIVLILAGCGVISRRESNPRSSPTKRTGRIPPSSLAINVVGHPHSERLRTILAESSGDPVWRSIDSVWEKGKVHLGSRNAWWWENPPPRR